MNNCIVLLGILFVSSCSGPDRLGLEAYMQWYYAPDCALKNSKQVGAYSFISEYRPLDFVVASELQKDGELSQQRFDSTKPSFEGMHYFVLKIKTSDPANDVLSFNAATSQDYYNRVQYFSELAQNDFLLVSGEDTTQCGLYHFERTYNTSPYNNLILGFEKNKNNTGKPLTLVFNDRILGNGMLLFAYSQKTLTNIPQLKL